LDAMIWQKGDCTTANLSGAQGTGEMLKGEIWSKLTSSQSAAAGH